MLSRDSRHATCPKDCVGPEVLVMLLRANGHAKCPMGCKGSETIGRGCCAGCQSTVHLKIKRHTTDSLLPHKGV
eukprot:scaffold304515_cov18-Tisochrysis_lutea.AAC.3